MFKAITNYDQEYESKKKLIITNTAGNLII